MGVGGNFARSSLVIAESLRSFSTNAGSWVAGENSACLLRTFSLIQSTSSLTSLSLSNWSWISHKDGCDSTALDTSLGAMYVDEGGGLGDVPLDCLGAPSTHVLHLGQGSASTNE